MAFEGGYDDRWILQDVIKDRSYQLMFAGLRLASIQDANLRRLSERMHTDVGRHLERLVTLAQNRGVGLRRRQPLARAAEQGWNSPIPQGQGAYQGATERRRSESERGTRDTGYRGVPRFRERDEPREES